MPRPVWSGTISFGLVAIPVKLYSAVNSKSIAFNQLDDRTMERIRLKKVSGSTGEEVPPEHIIKGYEISDGNYVVVDMDELEPLLPVPTKTIDLEEFVDLDEIDPVFYNSSYVLAPDKLTKPYALLARAMEDGGKVAIGRFVMRTKQYLAAIRSVEGRLMMSTMVFADEVVPAETIPGLEDIEDEVLTEREMTMAISLVESMSTPFEPEKYHDTYREEVLNLIERKAQGLGLEKVETTAPAANVVDLMAALEASVNAAKAARGRHPAGGPEALSEARPRRAAAKAKAAKDDGEAEAEAPAPKKRARKSA
jgi:DNA end-binding protein Ku